jgi:hypothetical protein
LNDTFEMRSSRGTSAVEVPQSQCQCCSTGSKCMGCAGKIRQAPERGDRSRASRLPSVHGVRHHLSLRGVRFDAAVIREELAASLCCNVSARLACPPVCVSCKTRKTRAACGPASGESRSRAQPPGSHAQGWVQRGNVGPGGPRAAGIIGPERPTGLPAVLWCRHLLRCKVSRAQQIRSLVRFGDANQVRHHRVQAGGCRLA